MHHNPLAQHATDDRCVCGLHCYGSPWVTERLIDKQRLTGAESQWGPRERTFSQWWSQTPWIPGWWSLPQPPPQWWWRGSARWRPSRLKSDTHTERQRHTVWTWAHLPCKSIGKRQSQWGKGGLITPPPPSRLPRDEEGCSYFGAICIHTALLFQKVGLIVPDGGLGALHIKQWHIQVGLFPVQKAYSGRLFALTNRR